MSRAIAHDNPEIVAAKLRMAAFQDVLTGSGVEIPAGRIRSGLCSARTGMPARSSGWVEAFYSCPFSRFPSQNSASRILFIRISEIISPPSIAVAPPESPVPAPRGEKGTP